MASFESGFYTGEHILWEKITPAKRRRDSDASEDNGTAAPTVYVFQQSEHEKKVQQKAKTPNTTVAKAAAKITAPDLTSFLAESSGHPLIRFADFFEIQFSAVSVAQFSWVKLFRNCVSASKTGIPLSHVPGYVYEASINWIGQQHIEELSAFVQWSLRRICADLECYQTQDESSESMVGVFVALALVLRQRPYVLVHLMPILRDTSDYHWPDMLNVVAWMIAQASEEDLAVGLYAWSHILLPLWSENSSNPQFRDNVLEIVESIFHAPTNSRILKCGTLSNGDRLIPPKAFEILLRATFPPYSAITKDPLTVKRFQVKYAHLHQVAFGGSEPLKKEAREIFSFAIKAAGETLVTCPMKRQIYVFGAYLKTPDATRFGMRLI